MRSQVLHQAAQEPSMYTCRILVILVMLDLNPNQTSQGLKAQMVTAAWTAK